MWITIISIIITILMLVYLYNSINFCHKSKELRLKFTTNAYNVAKILTIIVILQNYFRKLSFLNNKFVRRFFKNKIIQIIIQKNSMLHIIFSIGAVETLAGVATCGERGGGLEVHMNLMPPRVSKVSPFSLFWIIQAASCGRHDSLPNSIFCSWNEKRILWWYFCKESASD